MNLLDLVKEQLSSSAISQIGTFLGEDTHHVTSGLSSAIPAILGGLMQKASTTTGANDLLSMIKNDDVSESFLGNIGGILNGGNSSNILSVGSGLLSSLFGDKLGSLTQLISGNSGLSSQSSSSLLSIAAPILMGVLGKQVRNQGLGVSGLASLLMSQKDAVKSALPSGIGNILNLNALGDFLGDNRQTGAPRPKMNHQEEEDKGGMSSILPWILLGLILLGGIYFWKSCQKDEATASVADTTVTDMDTMATDGTIQKTLSTGVNLNFGQYSIENELISFIEDQNRAVDKETWFNFRNLTFETNSAVIDATSENEVDNIAEILKAYPNVSLKIGGYTDNTGSDDINTKLSGDRASNVLKALVDRGIDASRLESEGYGPLHPLASNDTEEGRQQNRRIAVRVTKK